MRWSSSSCLATPSLEFSCSLLSGAKSGSSSRHGGAGSRLHIQIVSLFAVIAAVPTILIALVASTTLDRGLDRFFSTRTRAMIEQSLIVANAYVNEHAEAIRGEVLAMAYDLGRAKPVFDQDRDQFRKFLTAQATGRNLS